MALDFAGESDHDDNLVALRKMERITPSPAGIVSSFAESLPISLTVLLQSSSM
jgi:hypothetical protein